MDERGLNFMLSVVKGIEPGRAVADSLEEAGDTLFTFTCFPKSRWKSIRTSNAKEIKRRIKTQTVLPSAETAAMLFWGLLASGQITMRARSTAGEVSMRHE